MLPGVLGIPKKADAFKVLKSTSTYLMVEFNRKHSYGYKCYAWCIFSSLFDGMQRTISEDFVSY